MKVTRDFCPSDRYVYDFSLLEKGFSQIDTGSDAHYFGNWANPDTFVIISYVEGDCILIECETEKEFCREIRNMHKFQVVHTGRCRIDPGLKPEMAEKWEKLGLGDLL